MQVIIAETDVTELPDLHIKLMEDGKIAGEYRLVHYSPWNAWTQMKEGHFYGGDIYSYKSGRGIPRNLLSAAVSKLGNISAEKGVEITHEVDFMTPDSERIKKIYAEIGYIFNDDDSAFKVFTPKAF